MEGGDERTQDRMGGWSAAWLAQEGVLSAHGVVVQPEKRVSELGGGESTSKMGWGRRAENLEPKM